MQWRKYFKRLPLRILLLMLLFVAALFLFTLIVHEVLSENEQEFDIQVFHFFYNYIIAPGLTPLMKFFTFMGSVPIQITIYLGLLFFYFFIKKQKSTAWDIITIGVSGLLLTVLLKDIFQRARPVNPLINSAFGYSFPSGHASTSFILYGLLTYLIAKENISVLIKYILAIVLISLSLVIGFSRIYLRVHYASDVLAGFCTGYAWLFISVSLLKYFRK